MNNKKEEFYNVNITELREEYDAVINPKSSVYYTSWKEHIVAAINGNEWVIQNVLHHLTSKKIEQINRLETLNIVMKFIYFAGSSFISAIIVALTLGANAINYILGLLNDKNLLHADSTENAVSTLTKLYTENNLVMIQQLFKNIFIIVLIVD